MKNIKTILIAVLSFMLLFSISCKNEDKTGGGRGGETNSGNGGTLTGSSQSKSELVNFHNNKGFQPLVLYLQLKKL